MYEQQQLRALIDTAVDGILSIAADGRVRLYNRASEEIFGYMPGEVLGQNVAMLMPGHYADRHQGFIEHYLETGEARIIGIGRKVEGLRKDGTVFPMDLSVGEFSDNGERHFVGIVRDLTDEAAARDRMQSLQTQLETIGRHTAVTEMGAALAHELNQPLTAIDLFLVAAERELEKNPARAKELFARVRGEAARAGAIVRRIRQMVERSDGEHTEFPLSSVISSAVELCSVVDRERTHIDVTPVPPVKIHGDETQLRMILVNLIKNALDAMEDQLDRKITIHAEAGDAVTIDVCDNGPGISADIEDRLFEPFSSTKRKGLGIGLSICRTIAEGHGGTLIQISPADQTRGLGGACFRLKLPRGRGSERS